MQNKINKAMPMIIMIVLTYMFIWLSPEKTSKAQYNEIKTTGLTFTNVEDNVKTVSSPINADRNRLMVFDYLGPNRELGCECENTVYLQVIKFYKDGYSREEIVYETEHFDWKDEHKFYLYLPKDIYSERSQYKFYMVRDYSTLHNKGYFDPNKPYDPDGTHKDKFLLNIGYYEIGGIGVDNTRLKIGESTKAKFECNDFIGITTWSVENDAVLSIERDGTIVAKNSGKTYVILSIDGIEVFRQEIIVEQVKAPNEIRLYEGENREINVDGISGKVTWINGNNDIVKISDGKVYAIAPGEAIITGKYDNIEISIKVKVMEFSLNSSEVRLYSGETKYNWIVGNYSSATWQSSDEKITKVDNDGKITAISPGKAVIYAKVGSQTLQCKVEVLKSKISADTLEITLGDKIDLGIIGSSANQILSSSNEEVVAVRNSKFIAVDGGKATLSITVGNEVLNCKIKVNKLPAPDGFSYESSSSVIKLSWNKYKRADSYAVYMYDPDSKEYLLYDDVKNPSITVKNLEPGNTYIFKVAAYVEIQDLLVEQSLSDKIKCKTLKNDKTGWQTVDGKKYYYKDGFAVGSGIRKIDGNKYIFDTDGSLITSKFSTIDGIKYYSDNDGKVAVNTEVTDKSDNVTYVADKDGSLTKKKVKKEKSATKTVTFNDITMEIPTSWGSVTKEGDSYSYDFGSSIFMIYTDPKNGSLNWNKADWLVAEFEDVCCTYLDINKSKKYEYDKKISTYYLYTLELGLPGYSGYGSTPFKGRLTAFEYNGKYYVAVMMVEKSKCYDDSFDEYTDVVKSIKPVTKKSNSGSNNSGSGSGNSGGKTNSTTYVWVTEYGTHYHRINKCGNGTYWQEDIETAKKRGLTPCGKCYK